MDKVNQYRRRAAECRDLALGPTMADVRQNYADLADMWDRLADERLAFFEPTEEASAGKPKGRKS